MQFLAHHGLRVRTFFTFLLSLFVVGYSNLVAMQTTPETGTPQVLLQTSDGSVELSRAAVEQSELFKQMLEDIPHNASTQLVLPLANFTSEQVHLLIPYLESITSDEHNLVERPLTIDEYVQCGEMADFLDIQELKSMCEQSLVGFLRMYLSKNCSPDSFYRPLSAFFEQLSTLRQCVVKRAFCQIIFDMCAYSESIIDNKERILRYPKIRLSNNAQRILAQIGCDITLRCRKNLGKILFSTALRWSGVCKMSPCGHYVAWPDSGYDNKVIMRSIDEQTQVTFDTGSCNDLVTCLAFNLTSSYLAAVTNNGRFIMWNTLTGEEICSVADLWQDDSWSRVRFLPYDENIVLIYVSKKIMLWDVKQGTVIACHAVPERFQHSLYYYIVCSPCYKEILIHCWCFPHTLPYLYIWKFDGDETVSISLKKSIRNIHQVIYSQDGAYVIGIVEYLSSSGVQQKYAVESWCHSTGKSSNYIYVPACFFNILGEEIKSFSLIEYKGIVIIAFLYGFDAYRDYKKPQYNIGHFLSEPLINPLIGQAFVDEHLLFLQHFVDSDDYTQWHIKCLQELFTIMPHKLKFFLIKSVPKFKQLCARLLYGNNV